MFHISLINISFDFHDGGRHDTSYFVVTPHIIIKHLGVHLDVSAFFPCILYFKITWFKISSIVDSYWKVLYIWKQKRNEIWNICFAFFTSIQHHSQHHLHESSFIKKYILYCLYGFIALMYFYRLVFKNNVQNSMKNWSYL